MHSVTLLMDRVFDVQPDAFSGDARRTLFSFECDGRRFFSVLVDCLIQNWPAAKRSPRSWTNRAIGKRWWVCGFTRPEKSVHLALSTRHWL